MSRPKKDRDLFAGGGISEEAMLAYLQNTLTPDEKQQFEKLLNDDPFAREALEGLQATANTAAAAKTMVAIKHKVRQVTGATAPKTIQLHWTSYAWAAAVFGILLAVGFLLVNYMGKQNNNLAQNTEKTMSPETNLLEAKPEGEMLVAAEPTADSGAAMGSAQAEAYGSTMAMDSTIVAQNVAPMQYNLTVADANTPADNKAAKKQTETARNAAAQPPAAIPPVVVNSTITANGAPSGSTAAREQAAQADDMARQKSIAADKAKQSARKEVAEVTATQSPAEEKANSTGNVEQAMQLFNDGNYKESADKFDQILKKDPNNADALYFGGISEYINGKGSKGEKNFDKLLKGGTRYVEGSKWYKANILIQKGKKDDARKLLNDLANTNSSYKERAVKKLAEIGN